jgi:tRNA(Ile)-lysidine synthase
MQALKADGVLSAELVCAHINHQLRGAQAELDEDFVVAQAEELKLAVTTKRLDVRGFADRSKLSIETAGRKLRIEGLLDIAKTNNCRWIATGHQRNDNAETVIQRLLRGTGFRGLGGIWPVRELASGIGFARPLLCVTRDEIIEYLEQRNLKWRVDHTNYDCTYRRNFIRHRLIPALQQDYSGPIVEQLFDLSQSAGKFYSLICSCADKVRPQLADRSGENLKMDLKMFLAQPQPVKVELVRRSLATIGSGERDLTHLHYEKILQLAEQNISGRKVVLPNGFAVRHEYGNLIFARAKESAPPDARIAKSTKIEVPGRTRFGKSLVEATVFESGKGKFEKFKGEKKNLVEWFDFDKVNFPLKVRFREAGDRFWPLGLAGEKKVGKFLTAVRVPQELRRKTLIVTDSEKIIWVWPIRISEQAKVTDETGKILRLQITDKLST